MCPTGACSEVLLLQVCREMSHLELMLLPNHLNINSFCIYTIPRCAKAFCSIPLMSHSGQRLSVILLHIALACWFCLIAGCERFSDFYNFNTLKTAEELTDMMSVSCELLSNFLTLTLWKQLIGIVPESEKGCELLSNFLTLTLWKQLASSRVMIENCCELLSNFLTLTLWKQLGRIESE